MDERENSEKVKTRLQQWNSYLEQAHTFQPRFVKEEAEETPEVAGAPAGDEASAPSHAAENGHRANGKPTWVTEAVIEDSTGSASAADPLVVEVLPPESEIRSTQSGFRPRRPVAQDPQMLKQKKEFEQTRRTNTLLTGFVFILCLFVVALLVYIILR